MGGLGNVAGRIINSALFQEPAPTPGEAAVDAAIGGIAPAAGPVLSATGRAITRGVTGQTGAAGARRLGLQAIDLANGANASAATRAADFATRTGQRIKKLHHRAANVGGAVSAILTGDIGTAAGWWLGAHAARHLGVPRRLIEAAFMKPGFVNWLRNQPAGMTRRQVARAVAAAGITAGGVEAMGLSADEAQALIDTAPAPIFKRGTGKWHDPDNHRVVGTGTVGLDGYTYVQGERVRRATGEDMALSRAPDPEDE